MNIKTTRTHTKAKTATDQASYLSKEQLREQVQICARTTEKSVQNQHQPEIKAMPVNHVQITAQGW